MQTVFEVVLSLLYKLFQAGLPYEHVLVIPHSRDAAILSVAYNDHEAGDHQTVEVLRNGKFLLLKCGGMSLFLTNVVSIVM